MKSRGAQEVQGNQVLVYSVKLLYRKAGIEILRHTGIERALSNIATSIMMPAKQFNISCRSFPHVWNSRFYRQLGAPDIAR